MNAMELSGEEGDIQLSAQNKIVDAHLLYDIIRKLNASSVQGISFTRCTFYPNILHGFATDVIAEYPIKRLEFIDCPLQPADAQIIATLIQHNPIQLLTVNKSQIGDAGVKSIAAVMRDCRLQSLNLSQSRMTAEGAAALGKALAENANTIEVLNLDVNDIREGMPELARGLANTPIKSLSLNFTHFDEEGADELYVALRGKTTVEEIQLVGNRAVGNSMAPISHLIVECPMLRFMQLAICRLKDDDMIYLGEAIKRSESIQVVDLSQNAGIGLEGINYLIESVKGHKSISRIRLTPSEEAAVAAVEKLRAYIERLHSKKSKVMKVLLSIIHAPRLGQNSELKRLPKDLLRLVADRLPHDPSIT